MTVIQKEIQTIRALQIEASGRLSHLEKLTSELERANGPVEDGNLDQDWRKIDNSSDGSDK